MKIKLLLKNGQTEEVKAHRVLKDMFPSLKLYVHYSYLKGDDNKVTPGVYGISTEDGISIVNATYNDIHGIVAEVETLIFNYGEPKILIAASKLKVIFDQANLKTGRGVN